MQYRKEIDGLRAIAVTLVILNHLGITFFKGGYIGVDVFFVISGFLITSIIHEDIQKNRFTFSNFYRKRILRLAPAYFFVISICIILSYFFLAPIELVSFYKSTLASLIFASNIFMWKEVGGYFSATAEYIPLLHLWSLGVEEQFYVIWPTIILLLLRYFKKWIGIVVGLAIIIGCIFSYWISLKAPAIGYFLLPARVFELLLGAILVFIRPIKITSLTANAIGFSGLLLIIISSITLDSDSVFPGYLALYPCIGTALIIYILNKQTGPICAILSSKIATWIGKISYPLYLWHWPLIVFYKIRFGELGEGTTVVLILLIFIFAYLTYRFIELPIQNRYRLIVAKKVVLNGYVLPVLFFVCISIYAIGNDGFKDRFSSNVVMVDEYINSASYKIRSKCINTPANKLPPIDECILGKRGDDIEVLLVGDSHANHYSGMIDILLKNAHLTGYEVSLSSTIYLPNTNRDTVKKETFFPVPAFKVRNDLITSHLKNTKYDYVILAGSYADSIEVSNFSNGSNKTSLEVMEQSLNQAITAIENQGSIVFIIKGIPKVQQSDQFCPLRNQMFGEGTCSFDKKLHLNHFKTWEVMLDRLQKKHSKMVVISLDDYFCDSEKCYLERNGVPLYIDNKHINYKASENIGQYLISGGRNPFILK